MLVIQGEQDQVAPPENGAILKKAAPKRVVLHTLKDAGHLVHYEQRDQVVKLVLGFLQENESKFSEELESGIVG